MSFVLDPKDQVDGLSIYMIAGAVIQRGELLYIMASGRVAPADADTSATMPVMGIALNRAVVGAKVRVLKKGIIVGTAWTWNPGAELYASTAPGAMTETMPTPPDVVQQIGIADSATRITFNPQGASDAMISGGIGEYTYLVTRDNGTYSVFDMWGTLVSGPGADADTEINWALTNGGVGAVIALEPDTTFAINDPITFTANAQTLRGSRGSLIDGDALATTEHGIVLSGFNDCTMKDFSIQTQDGGTKTCHCIFIENGAGRFLIENVTFVDSDHSDIWIEGTTINDGHIHNCKLLDADNDCIYIDIDDANYLRRLKITDCEIMGGGARGIMFAATTGGYPNTLIQGNTIHDNGYEGIFAYDFEDSTIEANEIFSNGWSGIYIHTATGGTGIHDNDCYQNGRHGIFFTDVDHSLIEDNRCFENDVGDTNTYDGIYLDVASDDNLILGNKCNDNDRYGINVTGTRTRVKENDFNGNTTGAFNDGGTDTRTPFVFKEVVDPDSTVGDHPALVLPDTVDTPFRFQVMIPLEFQELVTAQVVVVQTSTGGPPDMQWSTTTDWGKLCAGENYNAGTDAETDQTTAVAQNNLVCIDVSSSLTGIAAGDLIGFVFIRRATQAGDTINADAYYMGFRLRYV